MTTISEKLKQIRSTKENIGSIIGKSIMSNENEIVHGIQGQLWDGKNSKGQDITPSYLEDTFFKTLSAAVKYAKWKDSFTRNPNRNYYAPNLFINGYFWSTMKIDPGTLRLDSNAFGKPIVEKYGETTFSLNPSNKEVVDKVRASIINNSKESMAL